MTSCQLLKKFLYTHYVCVMRYRYDIITQAFVFSIKKIYQTETLCHKTHVKLRRFCAKTLQDTNIWKECGHQTITVTAMPLRWNRHTHTHTHTSLSLSQDSLKENDAARSTNCEQWFFSDFALRRKQARQRGRELTWLVEGIQQWWVIRETLWKWKRDTLQNSQITLLPLKHTCISPPSYFL